VLSRRDAACGGFDFDRGEDGQLLPDVLGFNRDGAPADEIGTTGGCNAELHIATGARIGQLAAVIAKNSQMRVRTKR